MGNAFFELSRSVCKIFMLTFFADRRLFLESTVRLEFLT
jgi:hypothetical protein